MLKYKSHDEINNYRRARGKKGKVNEVKADVSGFNPKLFAPPCANAKGLLLKP
jgi:hypothetical protein